MNEAILTNIFCIIVLAVLFLGLNLQKTAKTKIDNCFSFVLVSAMAYMLVSIVCEIAEGKAELSVLGFIANLASFLMIDLIIIVFIGYLYALLEASGNKKAKMLMAIAILCYVRVIITLILAFTGYLFEIDANGHYVEKDLASIPYYFAFFVMILFVIAIFMNRTRFTPRQFIVMIFYEILPVAAGFAELYTNVYYLISIAITISTLLIYVLIQASTIQQALERESILKEISSTDQLTKLKNRHSYYDRISTIDKNEKVGVTFCDINGLKYINDHFGHAEGDGLIVRFANMLIDFFKNSEIYRISGDEFVVITPSDDKDEFESRVEEFKTEVRNNNNIAAVGYSYGSGDAFNQLLTESESFMYENKKKTPKLEEKN